MDPLAPLSAEQRARLAARGLDEAALASLAERLARGESAAPAVGRVEAPRAGDFEELPPPGPATAALEQEGVRSLRAGGTALVVLAGGMATRMGGCVKALVEVAPGKTFLDLRLAQVALLERRLGCRVPLWLMTSDATHEPLERALGAARLRPAEVELFRQGVGLRLLPDGTLFRDSAGHPSEHPPGHGDLPDALRRSGLLARFLAAGGRTLWLANLDNLGASVDPRILGWHLRHGGPLSCELVAKDPGDRGGIPVRWDHRPVVLEEHRLPPGFDAAQVPVFNTNTFLVQASALEALRPSWTWVPVAKEVEGRTAIQAERLLGELTCFLPTRFLLVPRRGPEARFLPVKSWQELEARRGEILALESLEGAA